MNKCLKALALIVILATLTIALLGCASVSEWVLKSVDMNGNILTTDQIYVVDQDLSKMTVKLENGDKYEIKSGKNAQTGSYKIDGTTLILDDGDVTLTGKIEDNTLTLDLSSLTGTNFIATFEKV